MTKLKIILVALCPLLNAFHAHLKHLTCEKYMDIEENRLKRLNVLCEYTNSIINHINILKQI